MRTLISVVAAAVMAAALPISAQKPAAADLAKKISGKWTINRALSPAFSGAGRGAPARGRNGGGGALFQRGGGRNPASEPTPSSAGDMTPAELAEREAMGRARQIAPTITIEASAEQVTFTDDRGALTCAANDKSRKEQMYGVEMGVKCKWDKDSLRQEFSTTKSKLIRQWSVDENARLVLKAKLEGVNQNTPEAIGVFDRVQ